MKIIEESKATSQCKTADLQVNQSLNYLACGAMVELMLDFYTNTNMLTYFDPALKTKHMNLLTSWKRESKKIFDFLEKSGNEAVIQHYHNLVNIFEALIQSMRGGIEDFTQLMALIEEYQKGELKILTDEPIMKRFMVFMGDFCLNGGMNDFKGDFDTLEEAAKFTEDFVSTLEFKWEHTWAHIYDNQQKKIVWNK